MLTQRFLPRPSPLITLSFFKQKSISKFNFHGTSLLSNPDSFLFFTSLSTRPLLFSNSISFSIRSLSSSQALLEIPNAVVSEIESDAEIESEEAEFGAEKDQIVTDGGLDEVLESKGEPRSGGESKRELLNLSVKEKKELASYAHSLGKKLKSQQVGKSGVTETVIMALGETLEANELLKLKIHNNCPGELDDVVKQLEEGTGSVVVGKIGRTVILYRPSLSKMKAVEKKRAQRISFRKQSVEKQPQSNTQVPRQPGRGRRGRSRFGA
ncbi:hypothetical protein M9H77_13561 [Catharanthus roseus]|uniref:Uncharacterized protein n=1 Tax=Catharanthus roseus TaxID=4058 RepID=A0ACC0BKT1_CATRO|nr:hypothetical protein M9H77_13561 [Catharanthus roseus]